MTGVPDDHNRYCTIVFEYDIRKVKGNPFHVGTPFGRPVVISKGDQLSEDDDEFYDYVDDPDEEETGVYNENWNSPENEKQRFAAAWHQAQREWDRHKGDFYEFMIKPLGYALAISGGCAVVIWLALMAASAVIK